MTDELLKLKQVIRATAVMLDAEVSLEDTHALAKAIAKYFELKEKKPREYWLVVNRVAQNPKGVFDTYAKALEYVEQNLEYEIVYVSEVFK
jgi:hypothetical protein